MLWLGFGAVATGHSKLQQNALLPQNCFTQSAAVRCTHFTQSIVPSQCATIIIIVWLESLAKKRNPSEYEILFDSLLLFATYEIF